MIPGEVSGRLQEIDAQVNYEQRKTEATEVRASVM